MTRPTSIEYRIQEDSSSQSITALQRYQNGDSLQVKLSVHAEETNIFPIEVTEITDGNWIDSQYYYDRGSFLKLKDKDQVRVLKGSREIETIDSESKNNRDYLRGIWSPRLTELLKNAPIPEALKSHPALEYL